MRGFKAVLSFSYRSNGERRMKMMLDVTDKAIKLRFKHAVFALLLVIASAAVVFASCGNTAYAANDASQAREGGKLVAQDYAAGSISAVPTNNLAMYDVYPTYLFFNIGTDPNLVNYRMCMDIRPVGGEWKTYTGMTYIQTYTIKGLSPKKKYEARLYYQNTWTGDTGPYSRVVRFKTAPDKKPPIKSVSVRAINVKKHHQRVYGYYTGLYLGTRVYYTYKIRTTVTLKKKPKTKFFYVNGKRFKGNRTKYTVTTKKQIRWYSSPRGVKYTVTAYSAQSKIWGGYSRLYSKTRKVR